MVRGMNEWVQTSGGAYRMLMDLNNNSTISVIHCVVSVK